MLLGNIAFQQSLCESAQAISIWNDWDARFVPLPLPFSDEIVLLNSLARLPCGALPGGAIRSWIFILLLVGSVLRCQYLLQRREWSILLPPIVGDDSFDGEDGPRPDWLPKLGVKWEVPACFYPRVQFDELRVLGACSDHL